MDPPSGRVQLTNWLNHLLRVDLTDGRTVIGRLVCTDNHPNIVLNYTKEYWLNENGQLNPGDDYRYTGLTMIPGKYVRKLSIPKSGQTQTAGVSSAGSEIDESNNCLRNEAFDGDGETL